jgi:hypothetical protein
MAHRRTTVVKFVRSPDSYTFDQITLDRPGNTLPTCDLERLDFLILYIVVSSFVTVNCQ